MCDLMAVSRLREAPMGRPLEGIVPLASLRTLSDKNPDGWGIAAWGDRGLFHVKAPEKASESRLYRFLAEEPIPAHTALLHLRDSSVGNNRFENTHPFVRIVGRRHVAFMHNGTLRGFQKPLATVRFHAAGGTDSEQAFCHLLETAWRPNSVRPPSRETVKKLLGWCESTNGLGRFNAWWTDGENLFVYRDRKGYNGLSLLAGKGWVLFSSKSFPPNDWTDLEPGTLQVWRRGERIS